MKIKELIELLKTKDEESTLYVATKDGYEQIGRVTNGKYFNTVAISTKVNLNVDQAEQMLYQLASYDNLTAENQEDISKILGEARVDEILSEIKHYQDQMKEVRTQISEDVDFGDDDTEEDEITDLEIQND